MTNIPIKIVFEYEELEKYKRGWNHLVANSPQKMPMSSWCWLSAYFELRLKEDEDWFCVIAGAPERVLGVLPVVVQRKKILGRYRYILKTPADDHTTQVDLVVDLTCAEKIIPLLITAALKQYPSCLYFEFSRLVEYSLTLTFLSSQRRKFPVFFIKDDAGKSSYLPTNILFEDYRKRLSRNSRLKLNKCRRKLNEDFEGIEFTVLDGENADSAELYRMATVEDRNWKGIAGSSILSSELRFKFYLLICERLADEGWLAWYFIENKDVAIAAYMAIKIADSVVIWKIGYDDNFSKYSPGNLLMENVIELSCHSVDINEVNFVSDKPFHSSWNVHKRNVYQVRLFRRGGNASSLIFILLKIKNYLKKNKQINSFYHLLKNKATILNHESQPK